MSTKLHILFQQARRKRKALFLPYFCVGYPSFMVSFKAADAALKAGAAALELGVPFSDPIADGPTLQKATFQALSHHTKVTDLFRLIRGLRKKGHRQPLLAMTYLNLVERMTWEGFARELSRSGGDGAIVPDLPLEQFPSLNALFRKKGLSLIPFIAPTSSPDRVKKADALGAPFLYYVSVTGVTGARKSLAPGLLPALRRLRGKLKTPVVVGFGIATAAQASKVGKAAEGVIIASALVQILSKARASQAAKRVGAFCRQIVKALH